MNKKTALHSFIKSNNTFSYSLLTLFIVSQLLVHLIWGPVDYQGSLRTHAGEAFEAYHGALNIERFGLKWWGLQDMATSPASEAHPYLYIHHPNFGLYFSTILGKIGLTGFSQQMALSSLWWSLGIVLFAVLMTRLSLSPVLGVASAALIGFDPQNAFFYGCNIHRAADFASATCVVLATVALIRSPKVWTILFMVAALFFAVGADYIQFIYLAVMAGCMVVVMPYLDQFMKSGQKEIVSKQISFNQHILHIGKCLIIVGVGAMIVFGARQMQVLGGAGVEIWKKDFLYQILNRTHKEQVYEGKWQEDTSSFYMENNVLNPGFAPKNSVGERVVAIGKVLFKNMAAFLFARLIIDSFWEMLPEVVLLLVGIFVLFGISLLWFYAKRGRCTSDCAIGFHNGTLLIAVNICIGIALFVMAFGMPTYFTQWFPAFRLPLFLSALMGALVIGRIATFLSRMQGIFLISLLLVFKLLSLPFVVQESQDVRLDHQRVCEKLEGKIVYTNFTSASVATYSHSVSCVPMPASFAQLAAAGRLAKISEFRFLLEKDARINSRYFTPDYILLFREVSGLESKDVAALRGSPHFVERTGGHSYALFERYTNE